MRARSSNQVVTIIFVISGPLARADLAGLCRRFCIGLARIGAGDVLCEVEGVDADAVTVEALARMQLAARRYGCQVSLRGASEPLRQLVAFMGLENVLLDKGPYTPHPALSHEV